MTQTLTTIKLPARVTHTETQTMRMTIHPMAVATTCLLLILGADLNVAVPINDDGSLDSATIDTPTWIPQQVQGTNKERTETSSSIWPTSSKIRSLQMKAPKILGNKPPPAERKLYSA